MRSRFLSIQIVIFFGTVLAVFVGCQTAKTSNLSLIKTYEDFIRDGSITKNQIEDKYGSPHSVYEDGRILIYHFYPEGGDDACYAGVLVFYKDNVLERHSLVKYGCR